jgi:ankyrin repeat protein
MTYRPQFRDKYHIPEKLTNPDLINQLYLIVSEGNYLRLKDFISQNHIVATSRNENNETLLHIIIKDTNLSQSDKYELCKLAILNGAIVNGFDKDNVTPLHLACAFQLERIVRLLLENGANTNALDNQNKSPIYYLIEGKKIQCPTSETKNIGSLTSNNSDQQKRALRDLEKDIKSIISNDETVLLNLSHLEFYLRGYSNVFPQEYKNFVNEYSKALSTVYTGTRMDRARTLREKLLEEKRKLLRPLENMINSNSLIKINNSRQPDGTVEILERVDTDRKIDELEISINKKITAIKESFSSMQESFNKEILRLGNSLNEMDNSFYNIFTLMFLVSGEQKLFEESNVTVSDLESNEKDISNDMTISIDETAFSELHIPYNEYANDESFQYFVNSIMPNVNLDQNGFTIEDLFDPLYLHYPNGININILFLTARYDHYKNRLVMNLRELINLFPIKYNTNIQNIDFNVFLNGIIPQVTIKIINIAYLLFMIKNELGNISLKLREIKNTFNELHRKYDYYSFMFKEIGKYFPVLEANINKHQNFDDLFTTFVSKSVDVVNRTIECIHDISSLVFLRSYYKNLNDPNLNVTEQIIDTPILKFSFPGSFKEFKNFMKGNDRQNLITLINEFVIKIDNINNTIIYKNGISRRDIKHGLLVPSNLKGIIGGIIGKTIVVGKFGENPSVTTTKFDNPEHLKFPVIFTNGNLHFNLFKYNLITHVIDKIKTNTQITGNNLASGIPGSSPFPTASTGNITDVNYVYPSATTQAQQAMNGTRRLEYTQNIDGSLFDDGDDNSTSQFINRAISQGGGQVSQFDINAISSRLGIPSIMVYSIIADITNKYINSYITGIANVSVNRAILEFLEENKLDTLGQLVNQVDIPRLSDLDTDATQLYNEILNEQGIIPNLVFPLPDKSNSHVVRLKGSKYNQRFLGEESCYLVNTDIVDLLLNPISKYVKRPNLNNKDNLGQSPVFYAIDTQNIGLIKKLLPGSEIKTLTNRMGYSALQYTINEQRDNINDNYLDVTETLSQDIFLDFQRMNKNNLPMYTNIIFPMAIHLINHHFFLLARNYHEQWTFEMFQDLVKKMNLDIRASAPILNFRNEIQSSESNVYVAGKKNLEKQISAKKKMISNLNKEKSHLENIDQKSEYEQERLREISQLLGKNTISLNLDIDRMNKMLRSNSSISSAQASQNSQVGQSDNVVSIYENVLRTVGDSLSYQELWNVYIKNQRNNPDHTLIIEKMNKYQQSIFKQDEYQIKNNLGPVYSFYKYLAIPHIDNYFNLPQEYGSINRTLDIIIDIITHIVKNIVIVNLYYTIISNLDEWSKNSFSENVDLTDVKKKLQLYLFGDIALPLVKHELTVHDHDGDFDDISIDEVFNQIIQILTTEPIGITSETVVIRNLRESFFPYYMEYISLVIRELKNLIDNYLNYMYTQGKNLEIITLMINQ